MLRRISLLTGLQSIFDNNEYSTKNLAACPAQSARDLRRHGICDFNQVFQNDREDREAGGSEQSGNGERCGYAAGIGREDEPDIRRGDYGDQDFDCAEVVFVAVCDGRADCGCYEADDDEERAGDSGVGFGEAMGLEDLV